MSEKKDCGNCTNQLGGFDGGFFGVPLTCECKVYGETENRKNCTEYEKRLTKSDLLMRIYELEEENEKLKKARDESDKFIVKKGLVIEFLNWCVENE